MMRILLTSWFGYSRKTGVGFYADQLAEHLNRLGTNVEAIKVGPPFDRLATYAIEGARRIRGRSKRQGPVAMTPMIRTAWNRARDYYFRWTCQRTNIDLYHEPNYIPLAFDGPIVTTVHDMSVLLHPQWHPPDRVRYFEENFWSRIPLTTRFIADSQFTRKEILRHSSIAPDQIEVVPLAARPSFRPLAPTEIRRGLAKLKLQPGYFLFVGTVEPRKNLSTLLDAYLGLPKHQQLKHPLVLAGRWGWERDRVQEQLDQHRDTIRVVGYVPESALAALYCGAAALVYPSLYEGFGLPPLEMMASGRPVIVSETTSLPEVVGSAALMIDPQDDVQIRDAMLQVVSDGELAADLVRRGLDRAGQFSWENTARKTLEVYRRALGLDQDLPLAA